MEQVNNSQDQGTNVISQQENIPEIVEHGASSTNRLSKDQQQTNNEQIEQQNQDQQQNLQIENNNMGNNQQEQQQQIDQYQQQMPINNLNNIQINNQDPKGLTQMTDENSNINQQPGFQIFKVKNKYSNQNSSSALKQTIQQVPILSYKAEIIWDPQPTSQDFYYNPLKNQTIKSLPKQQTKSMNVLTKKQMEDTVQKNNTQVPFVNLEKDNYIQDIANRKQYYGTLKSEQDTVCFAKTLQNIAKPMPKKKKKRQKTKFKIVKNNKNIEIIQETCKDYINDHRKLVNTEIVKLPNYEKSAPFLPSSLEFADQLIEEKQLFKEKYGFDEKNLRKNKCVLEQVVLSRLDKKQRFRQKVKILKQPLNIDEIANEQELVKLQQERLLNEMEKFKIAQQPINEIGQQQYNSQQPIQQKNFYNDDYYKEQQTNNKYNNFNDNNNKGDYSMKGLKQMEKSLAEKRQILEQQKKKNSQQSSRPLSRKSSAKSQPQLPKIKQNVVDFNKM